VCVKGQVPTGRGEARRQAGVVAGVGRAVEEVGGRRWWYRKCVGRSV